MATKRRSGTDEAPEPEVGLVADTDPDDDTDGFTVADVEDLADASDEDDDDDEDEDEDDEDAIVDEDDEGLDDDLAVVVDAVVDPARVAAVPSDDDESGPALLDDEDDEIAGIRPGIEFVCTRCHLVKRITQLAKRAPARTPFCRDCA